MVYLFPSPGHLLTFFRDFVSDAARRYGLEGVMDRHTTSRLNPRKEHRPEIGQITEKRGIMSKQLLVNNRLTVLQNVYHCRSDGRQSNSSNTV